MLASLIIPSNCRRKESLIRALSSAFDQNYANDEYEVLLVCDGDISLDISELLMSLKEKHMNFSYIQQTPFKGPAAARNLGVKNSKGNIICFTDDDCILNQDWLSKMIKRHQDYSVSVVGGLTYVTDENLSALVSQSLSNSSIKANIGGKQEIIFFPTCNVSFKRVIFDKNEFNERFVFPGGEDLEFCYRVFQEGYIFFFDNDIKVFHDCHKEGIKSYLRQAYLYGRGNYLVKKIYPTHPHLRELSLNKISFVFGTIKTFLKVPIFSFVLGKIFIKENNCNDLLSQLAVYFYFSLHKIFYQLGNIVECFNISQSDFLVSPFLVPKLLILDITHQCNLSCNICDIWQTREEDLNIEFIKNVLCQAKRLGVKEIALSGGEVLLRKDIFEIIQYAQDIGIKNLGILTNGILVLQYLEQLKPYLMDNTISLVISLDSLNANLHNFIRNSDTAWQDTINALKQLSLLKQQYPVINFSVITIILNDNLEELEDIIVFVKNLRANFLQFQVLLANNLRMAERKSSPFDVGEDRLPVLDDVVEKLVEIKKNNFAFIKNSEHNLTLVKKYYRGIIFADDVQCNCASKTILISNHGEATTCFGGYGDIKKQELCGILQSEKIKIAGRQVKKCGWPCLLPCFCD